MLFNEKLLNSDYCNDTDEYIEYIEKVVSELPGIIREELEYVNFKIQLNSTSSVNFY